MTVIGSTVTAAEGVKEAAITIENLTRSVIIAIELVRGGVVKATFYLLPDSPSLISGFIILYSNYNNKDTKNLITANHTYVAGGWLAYSI